MVLLFGRSSALALRAVCPVVRRLLVVAVLLQLGVGGLGRVLVRGAVVVELVAQAGALDVVGVAAGGGHRDLLPCTSSLGRSRRAVGEPPDAADGAADDLADPSALTEHRGEGAVMPDTVFVRASSATGAVHRLVEVVVGVLGMVADLAAEAEARDREQRVTQRR